jgi:hypothetical protein
MLNPHRVFRRKAMLRPVQMRGKGHPVLVDLREPSLPHGDHIVVLQTLGIHRENLLEAGTERHHLKTTAIGKRWPRPVHEATETACGLDDIWTRLQIEVVGVCK